MKLATLLLLLSLFLLNGSVNSVLYFSVRKYENLCLSCMSVKSIWTAMVQCKNDLRIS